MSVFKPNTSAENISYIENRNIDLELEIRINDLVWEINMK